MPARDWKKIEKKIRKSEFLTKLRSDIESSLDEIILHKDGKNKLKT